MKADEIKKLSARMRALGLISDKIHESQESQTKTSANQKKPVKRDHKMRHKFGKWGLTPHLVKKGYKLTDPQPPCQ